MQIYTHWEDRSGSEAISKMIGKAVRKIKCIEILLNGQLFHIDIDYDSAQMLPRLRLMVDDPRELLEILKMYKDRCVRVNLQSAADKNGGFSIVAISKICRTESEDREIQYSFIDTNNDMHFYSFVKNPIIIEGQIQTLWIHETTGISMAT